MFPVLHGYQWRTGHVAIELNWFGKGFGKKDRHVNLLQAIGRDGPKEARCMDRKYCATCDSCGCPLQRC